MSTLVILKTSDVIQYIIEDRNKTLVLHYNRKSRVFPKKLTSNFIRNKKHKSTLLSKTVEDLISYYLRNDIQVEILNAYNLN